MQSTQRSETGAREHSTTSYVTERSSWCYKHTKREVNEKDTWENFGTPWLGTPGQRHAQLPPKPFTPPVSSSFMSNIVATNR